MTREKCIKWLDQLANTFDYEKDAIELAILNEAMDCMRISFTPDEVSEVLVRSMEDIPGKAAFRPCEVYEALMNAMEDT